MLDFYIVLLAYPSTNEMFYEKAVLIDRFLSNIILLVLVHESDLYYEHWIKNVSYLHIQIIPQFIHFLLL